MPYFDNSNVAAQADIYSDILGFIDSIVKDNPHSSIILMGDMNCNFYRKDNQFSQILNDFIEQCDLFCTFDVMPSFNLDQSYTRCNLKQKSFSFLDYIFISRNLVPYITFVDILDSGHVLSDHIPVMMTIDINCETTFRPQRPFPSVIDWKAVDASTRAKYQDVMDDCLNSIRIPQILHGPLPLYCN